MNLDSLQLSGKTILVLGLFDRGWDLSKVVVEG
jgi:hypothetical protein